MVPLLSIIIVNWKSTHFLGPCLDSVYACNGDPALEVMVVDNASYDGCDKMLASSYPQVRFIQSSDNLGFAGANNSAYRESRAETLLFLNPDTEIVGQAVTTMYRLLWKTAGAGAIGCTLLNSDGSLQTSCVQAFPTILNQVFDAEALRRKFPLLPLWGSRPLFAKSDIPIPVEVASGACLMVKRHVFESVGLFSGEYFMYAEDTDLCYKIRAAGYGVYYTGAASVIHHGGGSSKQRGRTYFADVVMLESVFHFLKKSRGTLYSYLYRITLSGTALFRVVLISFLIGANPGESPRGTLKVSLGKWVNIFRWSLGCSGWARQLKRESSARD